MIHPVSLHSVTPASPVWFHEGRPLDPPLVHRVESFYVLKSCHITSAAASFLRRVECLVSFPRGSLVDMEGLRIQLGLCVGRQAAG